MSLRTADHARHPATARRGEASTEARPFERRTTWRENRPDSGWFSGLRAREIWAYRELARFLALRDLKLRYKQTAFGIAWAIIQPLTAAAIFAIVFGHLADVPSDGLPYLVFAYTGVALWTYLASSVSAAAESLVEHHDLVTKVAFPRILAPCAAVMPGLLDLAFSLVILGGFMALYGIAPPPAVALLPLWVAAAVMVALGAGMLLCALNVQYRDVRYALGFVVQTWLFVSPVAYPSSLVEGAWRYAYAANPMVGVIDGVRWSVAGGPAPGWADLVSLPAGVALLGLGIVYFGRVERRFADVI
jgi:lipopolysaccharide transport system permease protein